LKRVLWDTIRIRGAQQAHAGINPRSLEN
jgi:hypothetical protein